MQNRLEELRRSLGLTQAEFGEKNKMGTSTIAMIECGARSLTEKNAQILAERYGLNVGWLLGEDIPMRPPMTRAEEIQKFVGQIALKGEEKAKLMSILPRLDERHWSMLGEIIEVLYRDQEKQKKD